MKVIVTHTNADFDALAGMVACHKIYNDSVLLFPGSIEKNLKEYIETNKDKLPEIVSLKSFNMKDIEEIVLVDVGSKQRLGPVSTLIEGKRIILYDHHPGKSDISAEFSIDEESGAVTSIMTEILEQKGIPVTPFEATTFLLGIYEDTGFLTFSTVRSRDYDAAKRCLSWGADITEISKWLHRRITGSQLKILTKLVENLEFIVVGGLKIHITTFLSSEFYPDLSLLVHELLNTEDMKALFLVAYLESRVHIIARSRTPLVDVGKILEKFGGGGHPSAASATIKSSTVDETKRKLIDYLLLESSAGFKVKDFCQYDFAKGTPSMTIETALTEMNKYRINSLPIFVGNKVVGVVTRQEVDKTIQLKMGKEPVSTLIATPPPIFDPEDSIEKVQKEMLEKSYRVVLVGKSENDIVGIISRMSLFKKLYEKSVSVVSKAFGGAPSREEMVRVLESYFGKEELLNIRWLGQVSKKMSMKCYLVGGVVRDIMLHNKIKDLDFVVEGDAEKIAEKIASEKGGRVRSHAAFGTAIWMRPDGSRWDFATARSEYYESPASLPIVEEAGLIRDLSRRDFTINSMAISINPDDFGEIIDPFGGIKDLRQCRIKVLHGISIIDDPTRAFRAVRFAAKLNFEISPETKQLILNALKQGVFKHLSPKRVLSEILEILKSSSVIESLKMLEELQLLRLFWRSIKLTPKLMDRLYKAQKVSDFFEVNFPKEEFDRAAFFLLNLTDRLSTKELKEFIKYYPFSRKTKELLNTYREATWNLKKKLTIARSKKSEIYTAFASLPMILLLFYLSKCEKEEDEILIKNFILKERFVKLEINGEDLKKMGFQPGKHFSVALAETKAAKIDGQLRNKEDEINYAVSVIKRLSEKKDKN
ncbi:MAG: CBS domain-containing protein [Acidobacteria bacterium]|nr:CBS domain-containing protein [Acidobacteriota bacterium]